MVRKLLLVAVILLCSGIARAQGTGQHGDGVFGLCVLRRVQRHHAGERHRQRQPVLLRGAGLYLGAGGRKRRSRRQHALSNLASVAPNIAIGGIGSNTANACGTDNVCNVVNFSAVAGKASVGRLPQMLLPRPETTQPPQLPAALPHSTMRWWFRQWGGNRRLSRRPEPRHPASILRTLLARILPSMWGIKQSAQRGLTLPMRERSLPGHGEQWRSH